MDKLAFFTVIAFCLYFVVNMGINAEKRDEKRLEEKQEHLQKLFNNCVNTLNSIDNKKKQNYLACQEILKF